MSVPPALRRLADAFTSAPYAVTLGVGVAAIAADRVRLHLPYRDDNANRNGSVHGGVLASLVDMAGALAAWTGIAERPGLEAATADLSVHYVAPAIAEVVTAGATVVRRGREIAFATVEVATAAGAPVARGLVAHRVTGPRRAGTPPAGTYPAAPRDLAESALPSARRSGSPFSRLLGIRTAPCGAGHAVSLLPWQPGLADGEGRVHEGALATLADAAGGGAAWSAGGGFDPRGRAATLAMHLAYDARTRARTREEDVVGVGTTPWCVAGLAVNTVTLFGRASGRALATGTVTYRIVRPGD